jgi:dTDP-glucose 4,6-dehydratase
MPTFISQALRGEPLTVFGEGQQTRSFCYYEDLIDGFYRLLLSGENYPVNIGNANEISMLELAQTIIRVTGSNSTIVYKPLPQDDPRLRRPDISRATRILEWEAKVALEAGLIKTIEYFKTEEEVV